MPSMVYNHAKASLVDGTLDWDNPYQDFRALLVDPSYTPSHGHVSVSDIASHEVSGVGYSRLPLTNRTVVVDASANRVVLHADPITWTTIDVGDVGGVIVYRNAGDDSSSELVAFIGLPTISTNGSDLTIAWPNGVMYVQ